VLPEDVLSDELPFRELIDEDQTLPALLPGSCQEISPLEASGHQNHRRRKSTRTMVKEEH
jgi:hypothetical protein